MQNIEVNRLNDDIRNQGDLKPELHLLHHHDLAEVNAILGEIEESAADENAANGNATEENHSRQPAKLREMRAIFNHDDNNRAEKNESEDDDDKIEVVVLSGVFPLPIQYSCDGLLKRNDDPISGNLAFSDAPQVCICLSTCIVYIH